MGTDRRMSDTQHINTRADVPVPLPRPLRCFACSLMKLQTTQQCNSGYLTTRDRATNGTTLDSNADTMQAAHTTDFVPLFPTELFQHDERENKNIESEPRRIERQLFIASTTVADRSNPLPRYKPQGPLPPSAVRDENRSCSTYTYDAARQLR